MYALMTLAVILFLTVLAPLIVILPRRRLLTAAAVILFAGMIALMMLDSLLWSQSRFHINALTMKILGWQSWVFAGVIFVIGLFFETMLAKGVERFPGPQSSPRKARILRSRLVAASGSAGDGSATSPPRRRRRRSRR